MPRKRMIDPNFWRDEKISNCSYMERLLFQGLWTFAEDSGVGRANPLLIKADVFPYDPLREADIKTSLEKLSGLGLILLYERDSQMYYYIVNFGRHQTINKPSKCVLPMPNKDDYRSTTVVTPVVVASEDKLSKEKLKEDKKNIYGEFKNVALTPDEYSKLKIKLDEKTQDYIDRLSGYIASKGRRYKSHYATILNWWRKDNPDEDRPNQNLPGITRL